MQNRKSTELGLLSYLESQKSFLFSAASLPTQSHRPAPPASRWSGSPPWEVVKDGEGGWSRCGLEHPLVAGEARTLAAALASFPWLNRARFSTPWTVA